MNQYQGHNFEENNTNAEIKCPSCGKIVPYGGWHPFVEVDHGAKKFCSIGCFKQWADMNPRKGLFDFLK